MTGTTRRLGRGRSTGEQLPMLKRLGPAIAGLIAVAVLAIGVPSATGHPEECAGTAAWASADGDYSPYLTWQGVFAPYAAFNSDLAFEDGYAYQGNYDGVTIWDVRDPSNPTLVNQIVCPGSQNDVTINDGILITSTDSRRTNDGCNSTSTSTPEAPTTWEGIKVWDVRDPMAPALLKSVRTDCGSHTHTVLPESDRLLVYVSSYDVSGKNYRCENKNHKSHDKISIVEVPKANPGAAAVIATPVLFPDGGGDSR